MKKWRRRDTAWRVIFFSLVFFSCFALLTQASQKGTQEVRLGGGPAGGAKAMRMEGLAEAIRRTNPAMQTRVMSGVHSLGALGMMARGELELEVWGPDIILDAIKGEFGGKKVKVGPTDINVISPSHSARAAVILLDKVPINSISELKEKKYPIKLGIGPKGSNFEIRNRAVLEVYGITYDGIKSWGGKAMFTGDTATIDLMRDGMADGFVNFGTHPSGKIQELASSRNLKIFTVSDPEAIKRSMPFGFTQTELPKDTYAFMKEDMTTIENMESIVGPAKLDNQVAYGITRGIWENRNYLYNVHPLYKASLQPKVITQWAAGLRALGIKIHPGALKYWQEQGLVK
ncbi:MAG: TAXI family TRAP transporter solute-binding subunit [Desulfobacterales bacterium]|nr:TAXI family TRAP transporter solute-binding subunit [Desulfobacterales bacterium]